jgi:hypothetical protein
MLAVRSEASPHKAGQLHPPAGQDGDNLRDHTSSLLSMGSTLILPP